MPSPWPLYVGLSLLGLVVVSKIAMPFIERDLRDPNVPRAHFYSQEAWNNCAAMSKEAKQQGASYWTCHRPE